MAGPKPLLTEFGIDQRLESCVPFCWPYFRFTFSNTPFLRQNKTIDWTQYCFIYFSGQDLLKSTYVGTLSSLLLQCMTIIFGRGMSKLKRRDVCTKNN